MNSTADGRQVRPNAARSTQPSKSKRLAPRSRSPQKPTSSRSARDRKTFHGRRPATICHCKTASIHTHKLVPHTHFSTPHTHARVTGRPRGAAGRGGPRAVRVPACLCVAVCYYSVEMQIARWLAYASPFFVVAIFHYMRYARTPSSSASSIDPRTSAASRQLPEADGGAVRTVVRVQQALPVQL